MNTLADMIKNAEGGCQCSATRFRLTSTPIVLYVCHCRDCQKQSSSAFGMSLRMYRSDVEFLSESLKYWTSVADSGAPKLGAFCEVCGTRVFHARGFDSETINIKAGCLDDANGLSPVGHIWTSRAQPWVSFEKEDLTYPEQPANFDALIERWRARIELQNNA